MMSKMNFKCVAALMLLMGLASLALGRRLGPGAFLGDLSTTESAHEDTGRRQGRMLLDEDTDLTMWTAVYLNETEAFLETLPQNPNVNVELKFGAPNELCPCSALILAAERGNLLMVKELLDRGAFVDATTAKGGATPLFAASQEGYLDVVELLLSAGATPNLLTETGSSPLNVASERGHADIVVTLLDGGANSQQGDKSGQAPLHYASLTIGEASVRIASALLGRGANRNARDKDGWTPLMWAAYFGNEGTAEVLVNEGHADASAVDNQGKDAMAHTCQCESGEGVACPVGGCDNGGAEAIESFLTTCCGP